jgi:hypothetical protein
MPDDHKKIPNGGFIICHQSYETGRPCPGNEGFINREERSR